jgi:hypothetical protein
MKRVSLLTVIIFAAMQSFAQDTSFTALVSKAWKLDWYAQKDVKVLPDEAQRKGRMEFHKDHTVLSVEAGSEQPGTWAYDAPTKMLTITENSPQGKWKVKVLQLTDTVFEVEMNDPEKGLLKIHMVPK